MWRKVSRRASRLGGRTAAERALPHPEGEMDGKSADLTDQPTSKCKGPKPARHVLNNITLAAPFLKFNGLVLRTGHFQCPRRATQVFEIFRATSGGFFWRLKATNGETLCHSEVYTSKQSALAGIEATKKVAPSAPVHDKT